MIVANMATFPARKAGLKAAVERLLPQVDRLNLCLNEFEETPSWVSDYNHLSTVVPEQDLKDLGKFMFDHAPDDQVFLVDDDIVYPGDYVSRTLKRKEAAEETLGVPVAAGYHGTIYRRFDPGRIAKDVLFGRGWPQVGRMKVLHSYFDRLDRARIVSQVGTGTVLVSGSEMPVLSDMIGAQRRADVRFAALCQARQIPVVALPRDAGWMPSAEADEAAIYATYTSGLPEEFVAEVRGFAFKVKNCGKWIAS